jgi:hypothetical protein
MDVQDDDAVIVPAGRPGMISSTRAPSHFRASRRTPPSEHRAFTVHNPKSDAAQEGISTANDGVSCGD